tara:strand:+ start:71 stop:427 length:357 start_codon:yes stop_codon:yes gene_type:complete
MNKLIACLILFSVGCASTGVPNGNPCEERSFDEWLSFYDLKDKANSSWDEGYAPAFVWLNDVAHACYPDRFDSYLAEVAEVAEEDTRCDELSSSDLEPSYLAECELLTLDSYEKIEIK